MQVLKARRKFRSSRRLVDFLILLRDRLTAALPNSPAGRLRGKAAVMMLAKSRKSAECLRLGNEIPPGFSAFAMASVFPFQENFSYIGNLG